MTPRGGGLFLLPSVRAELEKLGPSSNWREGERTFGYASQNSEPLKAEINVGTKAAPDTGLRPGISICRVLNATAGAYSGDGAGQLSALRVRGLNVEASEGQLVGISSIVATESSKEAGANALGDAFAGYMVGISRKGTRVGGGLFVSGRRETASGRITAMEVVSDNETETAETYNGTLPGMKGIHLHALGQANSAAGLVLGKPSTAAFDVGIGAVSGSAVTAFIRDDSGAKYGALFRGTHEKAAIAVGSGAGGILVGAEEFSAAGPQLELYAGESNFDPIMRAGTGKPFASSIELKTEAGTSKWFMSASTNGFIAESGNGGSGVLFAASKTYTIARAGAARGMLRINESGLAIGEGAASSFGGGKSVIFLANAGTVPTTNPTGGGILYCEAGKLLYRGSSGTVKELATA